MSQDKKYIISIICKWRIDAMGELSTLPNIGKTVEQQLNEVEIETIK